MAGKLQGRVALVTGGARGLGAASAAAVLLAAGTKGIWIVDLTDRAAPRIMSSLALESSANRLFRRGNRLYVLGTYLTIVDISDLRAPRELKQFDTVTDTIAQTQTEVFIPLETGRKWYGDLQVKMRKGSRDMEEVQLHEMIVEVDSPENVPVVAAAAREMLARNHKSQKDYEVVVPLEQLMLAERTKRIFNIVLGSIASISLLVGGIGIMNVMLATVTERTREIGIRRALGAKRRHIVTQFLVETVVLSVGGGLVGVAPGLLIPVIAENTAKMRTIITPAAPVLAFLISAGVGVIFGIYPAWRAANMDPVEALRHE